MGNLGHSNAWVYKTEPLGYALDARQQLGECLVMLGVATWLHISELYDEITPKKLQPMTSTV